MNLRASCLWIACVAAAACWIRASPARAVPPPAPGPASSGTPDEEEGADIVVTGKRPPGAVVGDIPPELQYGPADIRAYGVSSVEDLLNELAPETRSDRGRGGEGPAVLLNGRRISSLTEIRDIPTEAILRVDILPEEVALKYGYSADQRVVNIVLRRRFRAVTAQGDGGTTTDGGGANGTAALDLLRIRGDDRLNLDAKYQRSAALTESQRGIDPPIDGPEDAGNYRTLTPATRTLSLNSVLAHPLSRRFAATLNGTLDVTDSDALRGLASALPPSGGDDGGDPLRQDTRSATGHLGATIGGDLARWRLSLTGGYDHGDTRTTTGAHADDASSAFGDRRARSISNSGNAQIVGNGPLLALPAGPLAATIKLGWTDTGFDARSTLAGITRSSSLARRDASAALSLDLPIASGKAHVLGGIGSLSANLNLAADQLSDFGTLTTLGYGLNWTPRTGINLIVSTTHDEAAPTIQQLGNPVVTTPGVRVFDYRTDQTATIAETGGGNAALVADSRHVDKLGLTLKPWADQDLTLSANYIRSSTRDPIAGFPAPSLAIEAAFPDRFSRDADGDLESIDVRPINFARENRQELRWGINFTEKLKTSPALIAAYRALRQQGALPGGFGGGGGSAGRGGDASSGGGPAGGSGGGHGGSGRGAAQGGRLQLSIYHTWYFRDDILTRAGGPRIDLLDGGTTGSGGGQPRHEIEAQLGVTENGLGARFTGDWRSATTATGGAGADGDLRFSALSTANLRLFADLGQQPSLLRHRWARGMRVTFTVTNLFDSRQHVRDAAGATPLAFQPGYLDPLGRTIRFSLRKLFF